MKPGQGDDYFRMMGAGEYMVWQAHDPPNFNKNVPVPPGRRSNHPAVNNPSSMANSPPAGESTDGGYVLPPGAVAYVS